MQLPTNFYTNYEKALLRSIAKYSKEIERIYQSAIVEVSIEADGIKVTTGGFNLDKFPKIKVKIDSVIIRMRNEITEKLKAATNEAWALANKKENETIERVLGKLNMPEKYKNIYFNQNEKALQAFNSRAVKGLKLSDRVWDLLKPYKFELEAGLADGINNGAPAARMASLLKKYLKEPDKLFRRVRDANNNLQLSKAAKAYNPGQGVYRSSYKNALRLTRTEVNMGYRSADALRWQEQKFVTGVEIKLSASHPKYDICDPCAGIYPKEFIWAGWHPQCLCYRVPVLATAAQNKDIAREILGIETNPIEIAYTKELPPGFKNYYAENEERIKGWKNPPYWLEDNREIIAKGVSLNVNYKSKVNENVEALIKGPALFDTRDLYTNGQGGYNESRLKFQEKLIAEYLKQGSTNLGTSYFLGGAPATGKSSLLETGIVKLPSGIMVIDPDKIKGMLPEYVEMNARKVFLSAGKVHEESSKLSKDIVQNAVLKNYDIVNDGIGDGGYEKLVQKINQQKSTGKKVVAEYITTDTETSVERALLRGEKTGRFVPEQYIRDMHREISILVPKLAKNGVFDELRLYDNNGARGSTPKLIFEQIGAKITVKDPALYKRFLNKAKL